MSEISVPRRAAVLPLAAFGVVALTLGIMSGVRPAQDTPFFIASAAHLRAGQLPYVGYLGYIALLALFQTLGLGLTAVVAVQCGMAALAVLALYDLARRVAGPLAGVLAATLYAIDVDVHRFAFYVISDSLFTSVCVLALYATYRAVTDGTPRWTGAAVALGVWMGLVRFNGWFMLPVLLEWLIESTGWPTARRWIVRGAAAVVYVPMVALALGSTASPSISNRLLREGNVIWGDAATAMTMPPDAGGSPSSAVGYVFRHPQASIRLMAARIWMEVSHVRPFYSRTHNRVVAVALPLLYASAALGCWTFRRSALSGISVLLFALELGLVAVTAADWDGRYLLMMFPLVTLWSGIGVASAIGGDRGMAVHA